MTENTVRNYFFQYLVGFKGQALIPRLEGITCAVGFRIENRDTISNHILFLRNGVIERIEEGPPDSADVQYTTSEETFFRIVAGKLRAERAFLTGNVSIGGNILRGLKLAFLLQEFFDRFPYQPSQTRGTNPIEDEDEAFEFPSGLVEEQISLPATGLIVKAVYPEEELIRARVILVPPHPYLGGSSDNALLLRLSSELAMRGAFVVRFDYRETLPDVTKRGGDVQAFWKTSDAGFRMGVDDLKIIHEWLPTQTFHAESEVVWVGYSYGAQVCLWAQEDCSPVRQVLISPVASQLGAEVQNCDCPTLLIGGTEDFATSTQDFRGLANRLSLETTLVEIEDADHFYTGKQAELIEATLCFLNLESRTLQPLVERMLR